MTYQSREEIEQALQQTGHTLTGQTYNQCTVDGLATIRWGGRIHTITVPPLKVYFDTVFVERKSDLPVFWRGNHQVAELPKSRAQGGAEKE